ncbi:SAM-dependent methyltransferase [Amycolatopsis pretoriensis]|uniref:SAM-dependent methyltransferase n=1 Tax=Amycolatopsis pretoriensis TaxID=218821 RepID=UPI003CC64FD2
MVAHGRALLEENDRTRFIAGDIFEPKSILEDETVLEHLDWSRPIGLMFVATLHHHKGDRHRPAEIMREYVDALPSGSYVAVSHLFDPGEGGRARVAGRAEPQTAQPGAAAHRRRGRPQTLIRNRHPQTGAGGEAPPANRHRGHRGRAVRAPAQQPPKPCSRPNPLRDP